MLKTRFFLNFVPPEYIQGNLECFLLESGELKEVIVVVSKYQVELARFGGPWMFYDAGMQKYKNQILQEQLVYLGCLLLFSQELYTFKAYFITPGSTYRQIPLPNEEVLRELGLDNGQ